MVNDSKSVSRILEKKVRRAVANGLKLGTLKVLADAQQLCPVKTNLLRSSLKSNADLINENNLVGYVWTNTKYATCVEYSTRAHEIKPVNAKALTIPMAGGELVWRGDKRKTKFTYGKKTVITDVVFRKKVWHPGTISQPFLRPAVDNNKIWILNKIASEINKIK